MAFTSADQVNTIVASGRADLAALARPHLTDPYFTLHAAAEYGYHGTTWPKQYLSGKQQLFVLVERAKAETKQRDALVRRPATHETMETDS